MDIERYMKGVVVGYHGKALGESAENPEKRKLGMRMFFKSETIADGRKTGRPLRSMPMMPSSPRTGKGAATIASWGDRWSRLSWEDVVRR